MTALIALARRVHADCWIFVLRTFWLFLLTTGAAYSPSALSAGQSGGKRTSAAERSDRRLERPTEDADHRPVLQDQPEVVFLLHGICRSSVDMAFLAGALRREGYEVVNWGYPSRRFSLEKLADRLADALKPYRNRRVSFVTHSMGGIVVRTFLGRHNPENVGRFVMIGTPNQGAFLADVLGDWLVFRVMFGPAGQQLRRGGAGGCSAAGIPTCEFGVLAGGTGRVHGMNPIIPGDNDGTVSVESTRLEGMKDFALLPYGHTYIQLMPRTVKNTIHFLKYGEFAETGDRTVAAHDPEATRASDSGMDAGAVATPSGRAGVHSR